MKSLLSCIVFISSLSLLAVANSASNSTHDPSCGVGKIEDRYFSVVGVQGTGIHLRQELRELEKDTELWNIFLQAFARFQATDQSEKVSYYQVAGIHGAPFKDWDGVTGQEGQEMMGYCPHASSMFGPWHRPYLALFEQILYDRAVEIANEHPAGEGRSKAMKIANRVRLPYWDWAINPPNRAEGVIPSSLRRPLAAVIFPNGTNGEIANPLYRYNFHPLNYDDFSALSEFQFKNWNHTIRYPLNGFALNASSRDEEVNMRVGEQQPNLRNMLYKLLTVYQPFMQVSNKANGGTIGNFETLHDGLHNVFGLGHMGVVEVSAFDPVFWFHHCNMDRIIALYQSRYPDSWIEDSEQATGTFAIPNGSMIGTASPLAPFHINELGDMWTASTSRNWTVFGYTYPELVSNPCNETLTSTINKLYKPQMQDLNSTNIIIPASGSNSTNNTTLTTEWGCEVKMPTDIKTSYSIRAFLGEPNPDPNKWPTDPNHAGQLASMSSPRMKSSVIVTGNIDLTEKLAQKHESGELKSLDKKSITAYLKENFTWRIQALNFTEIPRDNPPAGFKATVFNVLATIPEKDTEVSTWIGDIEYIHDIDENPPVHDDPISDGTIITLPASQIGGNDSTTESAAGGEDAELGSKTRTLNVTSIVTESVTIGTSSSHTPTPSLEISTAAAVTKEASKPTICAGPQTRYVTSTVTEYVTVSAGY